MPSTYSSNLRFELIGTGEQAGAWGATTNSNIGTLIEQAVAGRAAVSMLNADYTLTALNGAADESRAAILDITSSVSLTATRNVICPAVSKIYVVRNATLGGQSIVIKTAAGAGIPVANGYTQVVYCDGTDVRAGNSYTVAGVGAVGTPTYTFVGRTADGLYSPASGVVAMTAGGTERFRADSTGVQVTGTLRTPIGAAGTPPYTFTTDATSGMYLVSAGRLALTSDGQQVLVAGLASEGGGVQVRTLYAPVGGVYTNSMNGGQLAGLRNLIINGDFSVFQRGASQTTSGYGSDDRWFNANVGSTKTHSLIGAVIAGARPEQTNVSSTAVTSVTGAGNYVAKQQRIENLRAYAGRTITVSFWATSPSGTRQVAIDFAQNFGTGGSPSTPVTAIGAQKFTITTSWQRFSATIAIPTAVGKTFGTNNDDYLELTFWFDAGSDFNTRTATLGQQSGTFQIALVQVEEGIYATPFEILPRQTVFALCQRYYQQGFYAILYGAYTTGAYGQVQITAPVQMRNIPVVALTVGFSAATNAPTTANITSSSWLVRTTSTGTNPAAEVTGTYTASAEL